jgi:transcriptional regulator with XRE-family HTH domain
MPPEKPTWFAKRLGELRKAAKLSQYALAKRSGLSKQALSSLELGEREPSWLTVQRLCAALGVGCHEFVDPGLTLPEDRPARPRGRPRKEKGGPRK